MDNNCNYLHPVICVAESPEQAINYKWHSSSDKLDKNLVVMEAEEIRKLGQGKEDFWLPYDLAPGNVLIRHPYSQGYMLVTDAEEEYLSETVEGVFQIARCLGATKIVYKRCNIAEYTREVDNNNNVKYETVEADVKVLKSRNEGLLNRVCITREFPKQEFTSEQFAKAKLIVQERGLIVSRDIRSLLEARNPALGAPMTRQTVNVEISSSLNKALDIAFTLNVADSLFKLSSNTKIATKKKLDINVEWEIVF